MHVATGKELRWGERLRAIISPIGCHLPLRPLIAVLSLTTTTWSTCEFRGSDKGRKEKEGSLVLARLYPAVNLLHSSSLKAAAAGGR